jgi:drug/metabolite transporter (DMT)-like permease
MGGLWWLWIPITLVAATAQTVRNATQRKLQIDIGTLGATLVRFIYAIPFAILWVVFLHYTQDDSPITFSFQFCYWLAFGAIAQVAGTALMLKAMEQHNFAIATAYIKTEILQVAIFGLLFLGERLSLTTTLAILIASICVFALSISQVKDKQREPIPFFKSPVFYGVSSGAFFALSTVGFKGATLSLGGSVFFAASVSVLSAQILQSILLFSYLYLKNSAIITNLLSSWKTSSLVGISGAVASIGWFSAMAIEPIAHVRTLALIEVLMGYFISRVFFKDRLGKIQVLACCILTISIGLVTLGSKS